MTVVVLGAAGFVGANVVRGLADRRHDVTAFVRPRGDLWRLDGASCRLVEADLADADGLLARLADLGPTGVISSAAHGAYSTQGDLDRMLEVNVRAVAVVVEWALGAGVPVLHFGSSSEYGLQPSAPAETARLEPNSWYAVTKAAGTHLICDGVRRGLQATVLRLYSIYGPWEEPSRLMPTIAACAARGRLPPSLVTPTIARDFVHVDDVVRLVDRWLRDPGAGGKSAPIVNVGSGVQTDLGELIAMVRETFGIAEEPRWGTMAPRSWDTSAWRADATLARRRFGWRPEVDLRSGLTNLVEFVRGRPDRYPADF
jgi:dolichol-phosphate mannosyltransferase